MAFQSVDFVGKLVGRRHDGLHFGVHSFAGSVLREQFCGERVGEHAFGHAFVGEHGDFGDAVVAHDIVFEFGVCYFFGDGVVFKIKETAEHNQDYGVHPENAESERVFLFLAVIIGKGICRHFNRDFQCR